MANSVPRRREATVSLRRSAPATCYRRRPGNEQRPADPRRGVGRPPYQPTPTIIIEAGRALYARHSVEAISRSDAGAKNLRVTSVGVEEIIERSRANREKSIVFVTGIPGAGKTLVGLNVATRRRTFGEARAVYLSGNGPLVAVLQEALTRDELARIGNTERKALYASA